VFIAITVDEGAYGFPDGARTWRAAEEGHKQYFPPEQPCHLRLARTVRPASQRPPKLVRQSTWPSPPLTQTTSPPWEQANAHHSVSARTKRAKGQLDVHSCN